MESEAEFVVRYLEFVCIRSCKFTNDRPLVEKIVCTVFSDVFYMAQKLQNICLPVAIDIIADAAGSSLTQKRGCEQGDELFITDKPCLNIVKAINRLDSPERIILVLFHIDGMDVKRLAEMFAESVSRMEFLLSRARRQFIENLCRFMPPDSVLFAADIDKWLGLLNAYFKKDDTDRMKKAIFARLSGREKPDNE